MDNQTTDDPTTTKKRQRRRLLWAMAAGLSLLCALPVGAVVLWVAHGTVQAGKGQPTPDAATNVYLLHLSSGEEIGLRPVLAEERRDELAEQWRGLRADIVRTADPGEMPPKIQTTTLDVLAQDQDRARVSAGVQAVFWPAAGSSLWINGTVHPWSFELRHDSDGWRIWNVTPHPWCGGHVRADACN